MSLSVVLPFTSPYLHFTPYADGPPANGWNATGGGFGNMSPLGASTDASFRWTSGVGSGLELQFNGTDAYVYGTTSSSSAAYTLTVDGTAPTSDQGSTDGLLGSFTSLSSSSVHNLIFNTTSASADDWISINRVVLGIPKPGGSTNITTDDQQFIYKGTWGSGAAAAAGAYMGSTTYTQSKGAVSEFNFTGTAVYVFGSVQPDHGLYSISLDGSLSPNPSSLSSSSSQPLSQNLNSFNGSSRTGFVQQLLFFASGLDDTFHKLVMTDEDGSKFDLDYAVVIGKVSNARTRRIAGISVGAILAAGVTGFVIFWIWLQERNGRRKLHQYVQQYVEKSGGY